MKNKMRMLKVVLVLSAVLLWGIPSEAIHKGAGDLTCGNCHTMHNSQGGSGLGGAAGGSLVLLRADVSGRENIHKLCLQCHSEQGTQANTEHQPQNVYAPKVHITSGTLWTQDDHLTKLGAGGNFFPEVKADFSLDTFGSTAAVGKGHSLGLTNVTPPGGDTSISGFSCTNCHDPHGTASDSDTNINRYRNLRKSVVGGGGNTGVALSNQTSWVGGINPNGLTGNFTGVSPLGGSGSGNVIWPVIKETPTNNAGTDSPLSNSYGVGSTNGISRWCAQCHDDWHEGLVSGNKSDNDWKRHPVDNTLTGDGSTTSGAGVTIINTANYVVTTAGQYLPVASNASTNRVFYKTDESTDRVMCLSCHFAHGGPNNDILRWDYTSAVASGSQTGNAISSTRGCQLCHNR